ncbi:MAG: hypothetical protein Q9195_007294 [Heterodermia aff. obscurata]
MEAAGFVISAAGLATLFDACLRGFDLLEQGRHFSRDLTVLITRLDAQKAIFTIWGSAVGLSTVEGFSGTACPQELELRRLIKNHLECISMIFEDASQLTQKYGLTPGKNVAASDNALADLPLRSCIHWLQKKTSRRRKAKWAIRDFAKFKIMLDDLSTLITELREITASVADIRRQREYFVEELSHCNDTESLQIIEEALSTEDPALSYAASERRSALTEAAMTARSFSFSAGTRDGGDDHHDEMETQADSDPDAQSLLLDIPTADTVDSATLADGEKPFEISVKYGHQNNLSDIQRIDSAAVHHLVSKDSPKSMAALDALIQQGMPRSAARRHMRELQHWQATATETPFVSIGLEEESGESGHCLVRVFQCTMSVANFVKNRLVGKFQAPVISSLRSDNVEDVLTRFRLVHRMKVEFSLFQLLFPTTSLSRLRNVDS